MIYEQNCYNINIKYYEELIKVDIENIQNNIEKFKIYEYILQTFKFNLCNMIIKYHEIEYLIFSEKDLKIVFRIL